LRNNLNRTKNSYLSLDPGPSPSGELLKRSDIDEKYKWNLNDIYPDLLSWEKDFEWLNENYKKYDQHKGKLSSSAQLLLDALKFDEIIGIKTDRLYLYAFLSKDLDLKDEKSQALFDKIVNLHSKVSAAGAFLIPEIISIPENDLWKFVDELDELKTFRHFFENVLRTKDHTLSPEMEELLALSSPLARTPYNTFGFLSNADIKFGIVKDNEGNDFTISHGRFYSALESPDRNFRERVYKEFYKPFKQFKNTFSALFNGNLQGLIFESKARKYISTREAALDANNIPISVYDSLVKTANDNLEPLHRWCSLKKKILGVNEIHPYDTYVSLFPSVSKKYSYDESVEILLDALKPLGDEYLSDLKKAFDNRWIDVFETESKRSGAYSSGVTYDTHPYVLLNWNNRLDDLFTFAHEMGHNMHSYYTEQNQPYIYADYSIFIAEVASTLNEALLLNYLLENAESKKEKLALIEKQLNNITTTFYRQIRFAEFEQFVHEKSHKGEALTPEILSKQYGEMYGRYWGPEMVVDDEETYTWARVPHFYYNFYVYQYATSYAASQVLVNNIFTGNKTAIDKYLNFLKAGNSAYPIDVLRDAGVDMNSPAPILAVTQKMNDLLDQMEQLLAE